MGDEEEIEVMAAAAAAKCDGRDAARRVFVYVAWVYDHVRRSTVVLMVIFLWFALATNREPQERRTEHA